MTNREIYELYGCLIRNQHIRYSKTAYTAYKNLGMIRTQGDTIDKLRQSLLKEYGDQLDNGKVRFKNTDSYRAYQQKEKELMDTEETIELCKIPRGVFDGEVEKLITEEGVTIGDCDILSRYIVEEQP